VTALDQPLPRELAPGLARWEAPHPEWKEGGGWDEMVGSVLYEVAGMVALFDPQLPREGGEEFLAWLDERVAGRPVTVLTTIRWHTRDREQLIERYAGRSSQAPNFIPPGVVPKVLHGAEEMLFWLPAPRALVLGDCLIGSEGGVRVCPEDWLQDVKVDRRGLAELLTGLVELRPQMLLVSHGEPVLKDGDVALVRAIGEARAG
jgi:hypothetical protein